MIYSSVNLVLCFLRNWYEKYCNICYIYIADIMPNASSTTRKLCNEIYRVKHEIGTIMGGYIIYIYDYFENGKLDKFFLNVFYNIHRKYRITFEWMYAILYRFECYTWYIYIYIFLFWHEAPFRWNGIYLFIHFFAQITILRRMVFDNCTSHFFFFFGNGRYSFFTIFITCILYIAYSCVDESRVRMPNDSLAYENIGI